MGILTYMQDFCSIDSKRYNSMLFYTLQKRTFLIAVSVMLSFIHCFYCFTKRLMKFKMAGLEFVHFCRNCSQVVFDTATELV